MSYDIWYRRYDILYMIYVLYRISEGYGYGRNHI